jgi:serine/threonine-protein kinase
VSSDSEHSSQPAAKRRDRLNLIGTVLEGKFQIEEIIGAGGMSVVYKAKQLSVGRYVAIKTMRLEIGDQQSTLAERFQREINLLCTLNHPHIVTVYDCFVGPDDQHYVVMDYLRGKSLEQLIEADGALPVERAVQIAVQICSALEHAHRKGIVHRDLKPGNIVLMDEETDFVKVVDFGMSKIKHDNKRLTHTGEVWGSPSYMSPEQAQSKPDDERSDIYSAGALLYEMLTGKDPFHYAESMFELMMLHVQTPPAPMSTTNPDVRIPEKLEQVAMKAMEKDPNNRFQSAAEMLDAIVESGAATESKQLGELLRLADGAHQRGQSGSHPVATDSTAKTDSIVSQTATPHISQPGIGLPSTSQASIPTTETQQPAAAPVSGNKPAGGLWGLWPAVAAVGLGALMFLQFAPRWQQHDSTKAPNAVSTGAAVAPADNGITAGQNARLPLTIDPQDEKIGVSDHEIEIGAALPLTGILKERGAQAKQGLEAYVRYINDEGGVNGRQIKLELSDDSYNREKADEVFDKYIRGKVFAGGFCIGSATSAEYVSRAQATSTPMLGYLTGIPTVSQYHPTQFSFRPSYIDEEKQLVDNFYQHGARKFGMIYQSDPFGFAMHDALVSALQAHGLHIFKDEDYDRDKGNVDAAWSHVHDAHPDVIMVASTGGALKSLIKLRSESTDKPPLACISIAIDYLHDTGKLCDGNVVAEVMPPLNQRTHAVMLYNELSNKYQSKTPPSMTGLDAFLNAMVLVEGLKRAGKDLTRTGFIHGVEQLKDFDLGLDPVYKLRYSADNHNGLSVDTIRVSVIKDAEPARVADADWPSILRGSP